MTNKSARNAPIQCKVQMPACVKCNPRFAKCRYTALRGMTTRKCVPLAGTKKFPDCRAVSRQSGVSRRNPEVRLFDSYRNRRVRRYFGRDRAAGHVKRRDTVFQAVREVRCGETDREPNIGCSRLICQVDCTKYHTAAILGTLQNRKAHTIALGFDGVPAERQEALVRGS